MAVELAAARLQPVLDRRRGRVLAARPGERGEVHHCGDAAKGGGARRVFGRLGVDVGATGPLALDALGDVGVRFDAARQHDLAGCVYRAGGFRWIEGGVHEYCDLLALHADVHGHGPTGCHDKPVADDEIEHGGIPFRQ